MKIQWFPGHMTKALRMMQENISLCDCAGYVLDARAPFSCLNPQFSKLLEGKPCIFIINKTDLADSKKVSAWQNYFAQKGYTSICVSGINSTEKKKIIEAFKSITLSITEKYKAKGVNKIIRAMIVGVPNSGKSTIINCLSSRKSTVTGDRPGVTKGKQWVRLGNGLELLDTPGTLWPKFENDTVALHLCYIGSIKDDIIDTTELGLTFIEEIVKLYPLAFADRYGIDVTAQNEEAGDNGLKTVKTAMEILTEICRKRGLLISGGELDIERGAKVVVDDFRKGKLGKITLEAPK